MFNAKDEVKKLIAFIRKYYQKNNLGGAILGIICGKDSEIVAALMVEALGKENVIGVTMPCHSHEEDKSDAKLISDHYGFKLVNFDLTEIFDNFQKEASRMCEYDIKTANNSNINLKPRLRMATLYYLAALYTQMLGKPYLVAGTSNKSELYVGYFTKGGDSVHDIAPIADFTVSEVIKIGEVLNVPSKVLYKTPSDGLSNMTDEDKLGVTYSDIEKYIENPEYVEEKTRIKIKKLHENNLHKFNIPTYRKNMK